MPVKNQGKSGGQVLGLVRNPQSGVKADELKWTGLDDFLSARLLQTVTKEQVLDFVKANAVDIKEVVRVINWHDT